MTASNFRRRGLVLFAPLLSALIMAAAPAPASAAGANVTGTVTVPTGADASHVHALLMDSSGGEAADVSVVDQSGTTTSGTYTFTGVGNGVYKLYFIDPAAGDDVAPVYYGGAATFAAAGTITVAGDYSVPNVALAAGGEIGGLVFDPNSGDTATSVEACLVGTPDPGQIAYWDSYSDGRLCSIGAVTSGSSTAAGSYSIGGLVPGADYRLDYTFANHAQGWSDDLYLQGHGVTADPAGAWSFSPLSGAQLIETFSIPGLGTISGTATDPGGHADSDMAVALTDSAGTQLQPGVVFANGVYSVGGLLPGAYRIQFIPASSLIAPQYFAGAATLESATPLTVGGGVTPNVNVTLTTAADIRGSVTAARGASKLGGIEVDALDANGSLVASTVSNPDGSYELTSLPAGTWYLRFDGGRDLGGGYYATQYYGGSATLAGSVPVVLAAGESLVDADQAMLAQSTTRPGAPAVSAGRLNGLGRDRAALRFKLTAGSGTAGYLKAFTVRLPKHIGWNHKQIGKFLKIPRDTFTYRIRRGQLIVTFASGRKTANVRVDAGGLTVGRAIQYEARIGAIRSDSVAVSSTDTTGLTTLLSFTVKRPR